MRTVGATILRSRSQSCIPVSVIDAGRHGFRAPVIGVAYLAVVAVCPLEVGCEAPLVVCELLSEFRRQ